MNRGTSQGIGVKSAARYFRAAHGMDRVHSRWTAWDVRRTRPAAVTPPMCALADSPSD